MPQTQAPTDPWAEAAKNFKLSADSGSAPAAGGNDDWKVWQQDGDSPATANGGGNGENFIQQRIDDAVNTPSDSGPRWLDSFGRGAGQAMLTPVAHPVQSAKGLVKALQPDSGAAGVAETLAGPAGPMMAHTVKGLYDDYKQNGLSHALGNVAGTVIGGKALGGIGEGVSDVAERLGGYKSPVIPDPLQNASQLAKVIRPPGGISHGFEQDLATNMPLIRAFAKEQGNPLHSQWEGATAARGLAQKGLEHFNTKFLDPNAARSVPLSEIPDYQGNSSEGMTSVGDINKRLSDINDMLRPSGNAKTMGAEMTAQQRLGLGNEAGRLRQILYSKLGESSGVAPEQIKGMREGYGQQFGIADTIDAARRARLGQIGAGEEGSTTPLDKAGILQKAFTKLRGGQQYLADSNFRKAVGKFDPTAPNYPEPMAKSLDATAANQDAAQREFLHQNFLDQLAKDSAAQRSEATNAFRQESKKSFGETMRSKSRQNATSRGDQ